jgi:hypothetical protein
VNASELRNRIDSACKEYDSLSGQLVKPINDMLIELNAETSHKGLP